MPFRIGDDNRDVPPYTSELTALSPSLQNCILLVLQSQKPGIFRGSCGSSIANQCFYYSYFRLWFSLFFSPPLLNGVKGSSEYCRKSGRGHSNRHSVSYQVLLPSACFYSGLLLQKRRNEFSPYCCKLILKFHYRFDSKFMAKVLSGEVCGSFL